MSEIPGPEVAVKARVPFQAAPITIPIAANSSSAWMNAKFAEIEKLSTEPARVAALTEIANYTNPHPGGFYDDLGDPMHEPHLVRGHGWRGDPQLYETAIDGVADVMPHT